MKAALLNLARAERATYGHVTEFTRYRLESVGITSVQLEEYLAVTE